MSSSGSRTGPDSSPIVAANIVSGYAQTGSSGGPTTLLTIPAGRSWKGWIGLTCTAENAAAATGVGVARITISLDANSTPAPGNIMYCEAKVAPNAAGGTTGDTSNNAVAMEHVISASSAGAVNVQYTTVVGSSSAGSAAVMASGMLQ